eukprot:5914438-Amphidinium_carterae.1
MQQLQAMCLSTSPAVAVDFGVPGSCASNNNTKTFTRRVDREMKLHQMSIMMWLSGRRSALAGLANSS